MSAPTQTKSPWNFPAASKVKPAAHGIQSNQPLQKWHRFNFTACQERQTRRDLCSTGRSEKWEVLKHKHSDYFLFLKKLKRKKKRRKKKTPSITGSLSQNYQKEAGRKSYFQCQQIWRAGEISPPTNLSSIPKFLLRQQKVQLLLDRGRRSSGSGKFG